MVEPSYEADGIRLLQGDALDLLPLLKPESINLVVTSPPFWGLRVYSGCPPSIWAGSTDCDHQWLSHLRSAESHLNKDFNERWGNSPGIKAQETAVSAPSIQTFTCSRCGAWRGWYGLEPEPDCLAWARGEEPCARCYLCHTRTVLRLLRRVLRKDGVLFWDIDDSRSSAGSYRSDGSHEHGVGRGQTGGARPTGSSISAKNLALIPERIALAAQADGWIVRSICVIPTWMPESARDRPTDAYRRVIIMVRSARYFWDAVAVKEPAADSTMKDRRRFTGRHTQRAYNPGYPDSLRKMFNHDGLPSLNQDGLRNLGNILDFPPASSVLPGSHFAAYPIEEPELFIRAACPPDGIVLDPFTGTGTTLVAARKLSRRAIGIEASPEFVAGCVERLRRGDKALRDLPELKAETAEQPVLL